MKLIQLFLILLALALYAHAAPPVVHLAWDPHPEGEVLAGYRVHLGEESRTYTQTIDYPEVKFAQKVEDLEAGKTYFCAVTAYNSDGVESDYSNEISFTVLPKPDAPTGLKIDVTIRVTVEVEPPGTP